VRADGIDRKQFLASILGELRSHELQLSTDPECSVVLERLLASMGDRGRRILGDSLAGNWETLIRHRFGSHVVQSWIRLGADALDREESSSTLSEEDSEIPSIQSLFTGLIESLRPTLATLLTHPHASPPVRLLFLVLSPERQLPDLGGGDMNGTAVRSKRSGKYRKNHSVEGKSFLDEEAEKGKKAKAKDEKRKVPKELEMLSKEVRKELTGKIGEGEWRIVGVDMVGSPAVQVGLVVSIGDLALMT
jgi:nucleolar protein 9